MNKKGAIEFSMTIIMIIIIGISVLALVIVYFNDDSRSWNKGRYCSVHPEDCECYHSDTNEEIDIEHCIEGWDYSFWREKNECQVKLEKEGRLGEDCFCEEYGEEFRTNDIGYYAVFEGLKEFKCEFLEYEEDMKRERYECKKCLKARIKTECEKGNQEYIKVYEDCPFTFELQKGTNITKIECGEPTCRKKVLSDYSCQELIELYPRCNPLSGKDCSKTDINNQLIIKGC